MEEMLVHLDAKSIRRSGNGLVVAGLSLHLGGKFFPSREWVDCAVVVLGWWTEAVIPLVQGASRPVESYFMEGPFLVEFVRLSTSVWTAACVERGRAPRVCHRAEIDAEHFIGSLLAASEILLDRCRADGLRSPDSTILATAAQRLHAAAQLKGR